MIDNPFRQSSYLLSAGLARQFPADTGREAAFAGRSNVGKSSVINTITDHRNLARTGKLPGRTRQLNFFKVDDATRLVDLPGYGYARVNQETRRQWQGLLDAYFSNRGSLAGLILILDIRRDISKGDIMMLDWCATAGVPVHILLNKADKLSRGLAAARLDAHSRGLPGQTAGVQLFSAANGNGVVQARDVLAGWLQKKAGPG